MSYNVDVNDVSSEGQTPIFCTDSKKLIKLLVDHGANLDIQDHQGNTRLHSAVMNKKFKLTTLLLSLGADPSIPNLEGSLAKNSHPNHRSNHSVEKFNRLFELYEMPIKEPEC